MKKAAEYLIGEYVTDGSTVIGQVVSKIGDPTRTDFCYLLLCNGSRQYTIYRCLKSCRTDLSLTRFVPEVVMRAFAKHILTGEMPEAPSEEDFAAIAPVKAVAVERNPVIREPKPEAEEFLPEVDFVL